MSNITTLSAGVFIPEIWSKEVTSAFNNNRVMANLVSRFDAEIKSKGDTVNIPNLSNLTATYKVSGSTVPTTAVTETSTALVVDKWAVNSITVDDIVKVQSQYDLLVEYTDKLGESLAEIQDDDIMALYTSFSQTIGATSSNTGLAWSTIVGAIRVLDSNNVPAKNRALVVDAYGLAQLRLMDQYTRYDATGRAGRMEKSEADGDIFGVPVYVSNNLPVTTSLVTGLLFHKEAIAMAQQKSIRTQSDYQARYLDTAVVADVLYGVKARRTNALVRVQYGQV
jgi:HK97 family phage major capsid protein